MTESSFSIAQLTLDAWRTGRKTRQSSGGWWSGNAVCCHHRGERQDKRGRGGVHVDGESVSYSCFNCGYKTGYQFGGALSQKFKQLLLWLNVDERTVDLLSLEALRHRGVESLIQRQRVTVPTFQPRELPADCELITRDNPRHREFVSYLESRCVDLSYPYMCSPDTEGRDAHRIVIPFTHCGTVVGHTARYLDDRSPKFISDTQAGYVFGLDLQRESSQYAIVVEGIFDALSLDALAVLHNEVNEQQASLIKSTNRDIIVVPDHDLAGLKLIDCALQHNWSVSVPDWPPGIKDVNDAVKTLGKAGTLITILANRETSKIKIEMTRKRLAKRLRN